MLLPDPLAAPPAGLEFGEVTLQGWPSFRGLGLSVCLHALVVLGLGSITFTGPVEKPKPPVAGPNPTVIRIGDRLYYVSQVNPPQPSVTAPVPRPVAAKAPAPVRPPVTPAIPVPAPLPFRAPAVAAAPQPAALPAPVAEGAPAPRVFIPPEVRKKVVSDVTLLQPLLPPAPIEVAPNLPSFVIATAQPRTRRILKPLVVPGRPAPKPPDPLQAVPPPNLDVIHPNPAPVNLNPALVLPPSLPSIAEAPPPKTAPTPPPAREGDPVDIISLNSRPVPPTPELVVPPGNVGGPVGDGATAGPGGSGSASRSAPATVARATPASADPRVTAPSATSAAPSAPSPSPSAAPAPATVTAPAVSPAAPTVTGGSRAGEVAILGGNAAPRAPAGPKIITRPANGTFDTVIVQSNPLDQFPESKGLLTGRPIYTVYISVGTAKDWALYFCIPGEAPSAAGSSPAVINLGSSAPVQPPYPTRMVRPDAIAVPPYYKYILVHGFVNAAGRVENLSVVRPIRPDTDQALMASLAGWEFRAATRDGVKTTVEFLLSIPVSGL